MHRIRRLALKRWKLHYGLFHFGFDVNLPHDSNWFIICPLNQLNNNYSGWVMLKKIAAIVLIVLAGGTWIYLDYLNKQEIQAAEELRQAMAQARAQALAREKAAVEAKAKFEATIQADLTACKATAEKAKADYLEANKKPVRRKPGQFAVPQTALDEAAKTQEAANAACQATYDTRLKSGS